jgi:hypothetical protein
MTTLRRTLSVLAVMTLCGCGSSSSVVTPVAPTPPTLVSIRITSEWTHTDPQHIRLTTVGSYSDGTTQTLPTDLMTWQSSNVDVAVVSGLGVVTVLADGATDVMATYEGKTGSVIFKFPDFFNI